MDAVDALVDYEGVFMLELSNTEAMAQVQEVSLSIEDSLGPVFLIEQDSILRTDRCLYR